MKTFRIHGDNIVECERIASIIVKTLKPQKLATHLLAPSTMAIEFIATYSDVHIQWRLELLPGFNKNTKKRWMGNIFDALREAGSFFDETPDAIVSEIDNEGHEKILLGIEFCSALQAGNQAWQRSARAFSTGRAGCPYLYIVDFVKYELNNKTRLRINPRLANPVTPYSYVNYYKKTGHFVAQLYIKSEEFDKSREPAIRDFDESDFSGKELGTYIIKLLLGMDTAGEEASILRKNENIVQFLAKKRNGKTNFTAEAWQEIHSLTTTDIIDYAVAKKYFGFHKKIAKKSHHGQSKEVVKLANQLGVGLASKDLPFGIIPANDRPEFAKKLSQFYPYTGAEIIDTISNSEKHLIIAIFKGFKPHGEDDRPDRGLLPLAAMLSSSDVEILTYLYGPINEANLNLLETDPERLAKKNGLWQSILALSNYVVLDAPVLADKGYDIAKIYDTRFIKEKYAAFGAGNPLTQKPAFPSIPVRYNEDDVDTAIHYLFSRILKKHCFEGMCNPPGGDWSGFSVLDGCWENRWLSLPRVSDFVNGKRPDHILEIFGAFEKPVLLSIESKEKSADLEADVGTKLITYISELMNFVPSAKRKISPCVDEWQWGDSKVNFHDFITISAAAYLRNYAEPAPAVFGKNCEILFVMDPLMTDRKIGWEVEIIPSTKRSDILKSFIVDKYNATGDKQFVLL